MPPQRALIAWDYTAHGIWKVASSEELSAVPPEGEWKAAPRVDRPRPWSDLLSADLLDALQEWNDDGEELFGGRGSPQIGGPKVDAFWRVAEELAKRTQHELGRSYEVLYIVPSGAWRWVVPPAQRRMG